MVPSDSLVSLQRYTNKACFKPPKKAMNHVGASDKQIPSCFLPLLRHDGCDPRTRPAGISRNFTVNDDGTN